MNKTQPRHLSTKTTRLRFSPLFGNKATSLKTKLKKN